jgi:tetratricopeptide (TPR) repeat protein
MRVGRFASATMCGLVLLVGGACSGDPGTPAESGLSEAGVLINNGVAALEKGQLDEAKAEFEQALKLEPTNKLAWYDLGVVAQARGDSAGAIRHYDKALESDPAYTPAMYNKAIVLEASDREAAIALYRKILGINAKASTTQFRLGLLLGKKGDKNGARDAFAQAAKLDPALAKMVPPAYRGDSSPSAEPSNR